MGTVALWMTAQRWGVNAPDSEPQRVWSSGDTNMLIMPPMQVRLRMPLMNQPANGPQAST
jgi:hypothetical protein